MVEESETVLVEIPDEDLPKLAAIYEKHKDRAPHAYSAITTAIEWKKKCKEKYMTLLSPHNCWKEDGTFFLLLEYYIYQLFIFSLDSTGKNVYEGLRVIEIEEQLDIFCVHSDLRPVVKKVMNERGLELGWDDKNYMFSISKEEALKYVIDCPLEVYIKRLDKTHAPILNSVWPHRYKDSEKVVSMLIDMNDGYGVFLKSNDELVSWVILSFVGQLALLQTKEGYKKKGYASLIAKYMSKELAKRGHNPFGTVRVENTASIKTFEKLGFKNLAFGYYIILRVSPKV